MLDSIPYINAPERITAPGLLAFDVLLSKLGLSARTATLRMEEGDGGPVLTFLIEDQGCVHSFYLFADGTRLTVGHEIPPATS